MTAMHTTEKAFKSLDCRLSFRMMGFILYVDHTFSPTFAQYNMIML